MLKLIYALHIAFFSARKMKNAGKLIRVTLYLLIAYLLYVRIRLIFSWSVDLDGSEYIFINLVQFLLQGKSFYGNPVQFPFMTDIYTPGYTCLLYSIARVFGWNYITNIHEIVIAARSIALLCMPVNVYFIYRCMKELRFQRNFILPLITLYILLITGHFYATRPDAIKTTLFTVIIFCIIKFLFSRGTAIYLVWFNLAVLLSVLFKNDSIINIFLVSGILFAGLRNRRAVALLTSAVFTIALVLGVLYLLCGRYFFTNILLMNFQQITDIYHSNNLKVMLFSLARCLPLFATGIYGCYLSFRGRNKNSFQYFIPLMAVACFIAAHAAMLRTGSYLNYSYEPNFLLILNLGLLITAYKDAVQKYLELLVAGAALYMALIFASNYMIHSYSFSTEAENNYRLQYFSLLQQRKDLVAITEGETMFFPNEKYTVFYPDQPLIYGYDMHMDRCIFVSIGLNVSSRQVFVSPDVYDHYFETGQVPYVVVDNDERSRIYINKYLPHYKYYTVEHNFIVYKYAS
jgi:hypothetical protein